MTFRSLMRAFGVDSYSDADISEAETENLMRDHQEALKRATASTEKIAETNGRLRSVIQKSKSSSFADLETSLQKEGSKHGRATVSH